MFLRIVSMGTVINSRYIQSISHSSPNTYVIRVLENNIYGTMLLGSGGVESRNTEIQVSKDQNPDDYAYISKWIDQHLFK